MKTSHYHAQTRWLVVIQLLTLLLLVGCTRIRTPEGWSGGTVKDDRLYIGTMEGDVRALDLQTGETVWKFELRGLEKNRFVYGTPAFADDGNVMFIGGYEGHLYAITTDREELWDSIVGEAAPIVGSPVVVDDLVLVGSSDGNLYAFDVNDGSIVWRFKTGNKVWSTPVVADGVAYFGSLDHNLYAVDVKDGSELWRFDAKGAITARPLIARGRIHVGSFSNNFFAIDAETGREVWRFDGASRWYWAGAIATEETIFAPSLDGNLYALDIETGQLKWTLNTEGPIMGSPVVIGDRIAVSSLDGRVRVVRLKDGNGEAQCNIGVQLPNSLAAYEDLIFLSGSDHTIRALKVKPNGNPDEEWVHRTDQDDPVAYDPSYNPPC